MRPLSAGVLVIAAAATLGFGQAPRPDAAGTVKVMTFNIQPGIDGSDKYNLQRAIDTIAKRSRISSVTRNHPYYNCDDQPARIAEGLKAATGRAWSVVYEQEWFTPNVECRDSGRDRPRRFQSDARGARTATDAHDVPRRLGAGDDDRRGDRR